MNLSVQKPEANCARNSGGRLKRTDRCEKGIVALNAGKVAR
jgi:hypothetical protein